MIRYIARRNLKLLVKKNNPSMSKEEANKLVSEMYVVKI